MTFKKYEIHFEYTTKGYNRAVEYLNYHNIEYSNNQSGYEIVKIANDDYNKLIYNEHLQR